MTMIDMTWRTPAFDGESDLQGYSIWTSVPSAGIEVVTETRVAADVHSWSGQVPDDAAVWLTARNKVGHSEPLIFADPRHQGPEVPLSAPRLSGTAADGRCTITIDGTGHYDGLEIWMDDGQISSRNPIASFPSTTYGMTNGVSYRFTVRAYLGDQGPAISNPVILTPVSLRPIVAPTIIAERRSDDPSQVDVVMTANGNQVWSGYRIVRFVPGGPVYGLPWGYRPNTVPSPVQNVPATACDLMLRVEYTNSEGLPATAESNVVSLPAA